MGELHRIVITVVAGESIGIELQRKIAVSGLRVGYPVILFEIDRERSGRDRGRRNRGHKGRDLRPRNMLQSALRHAGHLFPPRPTVLKAFGQLRRQGQDTLADNEGFIRPLKQRRSGFKRRIRNLRENGR